MTNSTTIEQAGADAAVDDPIQQIDDDGGGGGGGDEQQQANISSEQTAKRAEQEIDLLIKHKQLIRNKTEHVDELEMLKLVQDEAMRLPDLNIALSGLAGRFPKSDSINEFEENLRSGLDMINDQDNSRFTCALWGLPPRAGRLKDLSKFDCEFFGFKLDEANYIDFQLRILYEVVYESILDAGVNPASLRGSRTGVFFGLHCNEFENEMADDPAFKSNGYYAQFAVKVAQYFDFRGLTVTFDAACASGFVGFHNAVEAMQNGLIEQAIVCSSNIPIHPTGSFIFLQMQMLSPTGYSRFLDSRADGYVKSEACVSLLLQRKHLARRNYASIMATMTSVDGYKKEGITFPSDRSQEQLIRAAKQLAGISTNHVEYLEAHGTGTPAGDPQEARAISNVYYKLSGGGGGGGGAAGEVGGDEQDEEEEDQRTIGPLLLGSVKTNMGHSEAASGLCALAKVVLMFEHEIIYKSLHYEQPNTNIESLVDGRIKFVAENQPLRAKIIPLSCYGFGGSNVHAIVRANERPAIRGADLEKQGQPLVTSQQGGWPRLIVMFGRSEPALNELFNQLLDRDTFQTRNCLTDDFLALMNELNNVDQVDRLMTHRGFILVNPSDGSELARQIKRCELQQPRHLGGMSSQVDLGRKPHHLQDSLVRKCNLILPGVGSQWAGMAAGLQDFAPFWSTIERLEELLKPYEWDLDLFEALTSPDEKLFDSSMMCSTFVAVVAYQIALINVLRDQLRVRHLAGIVGHSLGEISCAYAANLFDEREAIMVAYQLGRTLDENRHLIGGRMVALSLDETEGQKLIDQFNGAKSATTTVAICCLNGPQSVTISGSHDDMHDFCSLLRELNIYFRRVNNSYALHNKQIMGRPEVRAKLRQSLERVLCPLTDYDRRPTGWLSSFEEELEGDSDAKARILQQANVDYFVEMLCNRVDFLRAVERLDDDSIVLEVGPSNLFESQLIQFERKASGGGARRSSKFHYVRTMKRLTPIDFQVQQLLMSLGQLYQAGATFDLNHFYHGAQGGFEFPVRRGTPSLSSLFKWQHEHSLFVPRYPIQFSKSSAKSEMPVDIVQDRDKYLADHCIEGRILYPATAYLYLMWRVFSFTKRKIFDACFHDVERELVPIEFRNVRLMRAVILGNRGSQVYVHFEEATGRFEIKEGGSVAVEGWAFSPTEQPEGLLYEDVRQRIQEEQLELTMSRDDIYKQFRVSGYDYGESFRNIEQCSYDGRYCRVKFNGHFIALTDSILQSIFLAVAEYAPSGGLFLPTRFDYVRFQPDQIVKKIRASKMMFDKSEGSLNTMAKREIMTKMMQRASGGAEQTTGDEPAEEEVKLEQQEQPKEEEEEQLECIFETYCDPVTGIIITDGIEMRGIRATPAPRRADTNEVLLESYQFVCDHEEPVEDEKLTRFESNLKNYTRACDSMSLELLDKVLCCSDSDESSSSGGSTNGRKSCQLAKREIDAYKRLHLACLSADDKERSERKLAAEAKEDHQEGAKENSHDDVYDIRKNAPRTLMSILDQLLGVDETTGSPPIRQLIQDNRLHLMRDLIQSPWTSERFMRPIIESVLENCCTKKMKLRMIEINQDDELMRAPLQQMIQQIEPTLSLDYSIAHPNPNRLCLSATSGGGGDQSSSSSAVKTHTLKDLPSLFSDNQLRNLDLIVYKDTSCYSLAQNSVSEAPPSMSSLNGAVRREGFVVVIMRNRLTFAERVLLALSKASGDDQDKSGQLNVERSEALRRVEQINTSLDSRYKLLLEEAERNKMLCLARKSDPNGCLVMLFKRTTHNYMGEENPVESSTAEEVEAPPPTKRDYLMVRVRHDRFDWLEELKNNFKQEEAKSTEGGENGEESDQQQEQQQQSDEEEQQVVEPRLVWLCAVATKQNPINGLVGMMQALRKELGSSKLRCFYDMCSFKNSDEPIHLSDIEQSSRFKQALERDQIWNCVDSLGRFGAYRHFTINDYTSHESSLCSSKLNNHLQLMEEQEQSELLEQQQDHSSRRRQQERKSSFAASMSQVDQLMIKGAYVNNATRGDLSSFAWFEAPHRYLSELERQQTVRVAYSALNFRDIMLASGRLPLDSLPIRQALSDCLLGLEFSGYDAQGRRVMGIVPGRGIATHLVCPEDSAIKVELPDWMELREAATIPVAYSTAIMALVYRARMRAGESILIHAGSGGVGQAAIRLAAHFGLTIYTTVGSSEKRQLLLEEFGDHLSDEQIFNSRDCSFEHRVMHATRGRGVDIVLNSLADDKLQASLRCLKDGGRFLEIGKYDLTMDTRMELMQLDINKSFHGILLDKLFDLDTATEAFKSQMKCVLDTLKQGVREGFVRPIKHKLFKRTQIEEAFRFMATGKHTGKVLIEIQPEPSGQRDQEALQQLVDQNRPVTNLKCVPRFQLSPTKSYIVTGGLGGFGMELCKWLAKQGARHLVLTSRSGLKTGYQRATLARLERNNGVKCLIVQEQEANASELEGARRLCQLALDWAPSGKLGGIFHLAMVLRDGLLDNMSAEDFELVCRPKVEACQQLDAASRHLDLDYFVAFSSVTSGKGNAGQSNYAYANSCLERICEWRRSIGQHGLAIQWGAIGDVGVAFENLGGNDVIIGGTIPQRMPSCLATLEKLLCSPFAVCLSVLPVDRSSDQARERGNLVDAIMHVLGIKDTSKVSEDATLGDLGLDSLMAVEIRQYIEREYDRTMNIQEIRSLTIGKIREIGESEKPASKKQQQEGQAAPTTSKVKEVSNYGAPAAKPAAKPAAVGAPPPKQQTTTKKEAVVQKSAQQATVNKSSNGTAQKATAVSSDRQLPAKPNNGNKLHNNGSNNGNGISLLSSEQQDLLLTRQKFFEENNLGALFEKNMVSTFVPPLELPRDDFCRLNFKEGLSGDTAPTTARPLFFVPPIHGSFEQLESICATIQRPCIGLNWTRKLGRVKSVSEAVQVYLDLLQRANWTREFAVQEVDPNSNNNNNNNGGARLGDSGDDDEPREQVIDLVGYSYGATVAFEMMLAIHKLQLDRQVAKANRKILPYCRNHLQPGHLVLLDGSPKQIELGSRYLSNLTRKKPLKLAEKIDELLMVYVIAHGRELGMKSAEYIRLQQQLAASEIEEKVKLASSRLVQVLKKNDANSNSESSQQQQQQQVGNGTNKAQPVASRRASLVTTTTTKRKTSTGADRQTEIAYAMEAFCRRYELVMNYKANERLPSDCTLIRAEKMYLQCEKEEERYNEDLELSTIVDGKVNLFVMRGDHETFLEINSRSISEIVTKLCSTNGSNGNQTRK